MIKRILSLCLILTMVGTMVACESGSVSVVPETTLEIMETEESTEIVENTEYDVTETTAQVETEPPTFDLDMTFVGDCLLATYKGEVYEGSFSWYEQNKEPGYFFSQVSDIFKNDDFTFVNLENVLTDNELSPCHKDSDPAFWFKAPTSTINILSSGGVEAVSLANNHTYDYGEQGMEDTKSALNRIGMTYGTDNDIVYFEKDGFTVAVICHGLWWEVEADQIVMKLHEAEERSDFQIVFYHGGKERLHQPEEWKQRASRKFVDEGADLVIGGHPHVLQPLEVYNGVNIIYSIGNFCFGGNSAPENATIVYKHKLTIDRETNKVISQETEMVPCYVYTGDTNNWQPTPMGETEDARRVLAFMNCEVDHPIG